jgi:hypothetical protein
MSTGNKTDTRSAQNNAFQLASMIASLGRRRQWMYKVIKFYEK